MQITFIAEKEKIIARDSDSKKDLKKLSKTVTKASFIRILHYLENKSLFWSDVENTSQQNKKNFERNVNRNQFGFKYRIVKSEVVTTILCSKQIKIFFLTLKNF